MLTQFEQKTKNQIRYYGKMMKKVIYKQLNVIRWYNLGYTNVTELQKKFKVRRALVKSTVEEYRLFGEFMPYQGYNITEKEEISIIVDKYMEENFWLAGKSLGEIKSNITKDLKVRISKKRLSRTFRGLGMRYQDTKCICKKKYNSKGPPGDVVRSCRQLFSFYERNVDVIYVDECKFFLMAGHRYCYTKKSFEERKSEHKKKIKDPKYEIIYACDTKGLVKLTIVKSATTKQEFTHFCNNLIRKNPGLKSGEQC